MSTLYAVCLFLMNKFWSKGMVGGVDIVKSCSVVPRASCKL